MKINLSLLATLSAWIGCGDGGSAGTGHVELSGKPASEGSSLAASAICTRDATCGTVEIQCSGGTGTSTTCSATITHPDQAACEARLQASLERLLSCPALTSAQVDMVETCVDAMVARPCVTQTQADELARTAEATMTLPPDPAPPECSFLRQPLPGC